MPYNHSNLDSDEVLYYVEGNYKARKGIEVGSLSLHPQGIPHGPHPGTPEATIGATHTNELAVMCDTFAPLYPTKAALAYDDLAYPQSWESGWEPGDAATSGHAATTGHAKPARGAKAGGRLVETKAATGAKSGAKGRSGARGGKSAKAVAAKSGKPAASRRGKSADTW